MSVYDTIREGLAEDGRKARAYDALLEASNRMSEALQDIAMTAQQASMHEPAQFCEWAYTRASEALGVNHQSQTRDS